MDYVKVAGKDIPVLLAITAQEQEKGLMYQSDPPPAMAFIYDKPTLNQFWMKNCSFKLDLLFCLKNKVAAIRTGEPNSTAIIGNGIISDLVIEMPFGTCAKAGIKEGSEISLELEADSKMKILSSKVFHY